MRCMLLGLREEGEGWEVMFGIPGEGDVPGRWFFLRMTNIEAHVFFERAGGPMRVVEQFGDQFGSYWDVDESCIKRRLSVKERRL